MFTIRKLKVNDINEIITLCKNTVLAININDYTENQVKIWSEAIGKDTWKNSLIINDSFVAVKNDDSMIIGFADLTNEGCLSKGYVHKDYQHMGVGTALLQTREQKAIDLGLERVFSEISITAKPFFLKHGYVIEKKQEVTLNQTKFINYLVTKKL